MTKPDLDQLNLPAGLADRWETTVSEAAKHAYEARKRILEAIGERPYKGVPVDPNERLAQHMQLRQDSVALTELLRQNTITKPDGSIRVRKSFVGAMRAMEQQLRGPVNELPTS